MHSVPGKKGFCNKTTQKRRDKEMFKSTSLFSQVSCLISRNKFARHVWDLQGDKHIKKFYC